jgi:hypothetical protein
MKKKRKTAMGLVDQTAFCLRKRSTNRHLYREWHSRPSVFKLKSISQANLHFELPSCLSTRQLPCLSRDIKPPTVLHIFFSSDQFWFLSREPKSVHNSVYRLSIFLPTVDIKSLSPFFSTLVEYYECIIASSCLRLASSCLSGAGRLFLYYSNVPVTEVLLCQQS